MGGKKSSVKSMVCSIYAGWLSRISLEIALHSVPEVKVNLSLFHLDQTFIHHSTAIELHGSHCIKRLL